MKSKGLKEAHTPNTKKGMGDFYGTGVRNPQGRSLDISVQAVPKVKKAKAPRSLA